MSSRFFCPTRSDFFSTSGDGSPTFCRSTEVAQLFVETPVFDVFSAFRRPIGRNVSAPSTASGEGIRPLPKAPDARLWFLTYSPSLRRARARQKKSRVSENVFSFYFPTRSDFFSTSGDASPTFCRNIGDKSPTYRRNAGFRRISDVSASEADLCPLRALGDRERVAKFQTLRKYSGVFFSRFGQRSKKIFERFGNTWKKYDPETDVRSPGTLNASRRSKHF
ncbi:unnamed protein product [Macrosiphum euphorbiae]|uniref:Uncharacterized protein n=1 Tax=Macrosiphum euphorbiae TaxID=13131 RepID=A0AAV0Y1A0_9HEMI|nr:unnamed protein product [Macrosiphum euphorbiae]